MHELRKMLERELDKITKKGELSAGALDVVDKITHSIKSIDTIMAMEDAGYSNEESYNRGSYARGRGARRDSMGRYADNSYEYSRRRGNSYGYSRDNLMDELEELEDKVQDEESKQMIRKWMKQAQNV